jgi:hypothetical protein
MPTVVLWFTVEPSAVLTKVSCRTDEVMTTYVND